MIFYPVFSAATVLTPPGEWHFEFAKTKVIYCEEISRDEDNSHCRVSKNGKTYKLFCPSLDKVNVRLKQVDKSFYCVADKEVCISPNPCNILEKVVYRPGTDICQHGEIRNERKCSEGHVYKIDFQKDGATGQQLIDKCCQKKQAFARPGVTK